MRAQPCPGRGVLVRGMLATGVSLEYAKSEIIAVEPELGIAAENAPTMTVLTGPEEPLRRVHGRLEQDGIWARRVADDTPAHSWMLEEHLSGFAADIDGLSPADSAVKMVSTVDGTTIEGHRLDVDYWKRQLRNQVQFHTALVNSVPAEGRCLVLELGSLPVLERPLLEAFGRYDLPATVVNGGVAQFDERTSLHRMLAQCYTHGVDPAWPHPPASPAPLEPPRWHHTPHERPEVPDLESLPVTEVPTRLREEVHRIVAELASTAITAEDRDTELEVLGVSSLQLGILRAQLAALHPAIRGALSADISHIPTINGMTDAVLDVIAPREADPAI